MTKKTGKKTLSVELPVDLYDMYAKLCIDLNLTKTEGIYRYLQYLQKKYYKHRQAINADSDDDFSLSNGNT
jgi:hypothetical protein